MDKPKIRAKLTTLGQQDATDQILETCHRKGFTRGIWEDNGESYEVSQPLFLSSLFRQEPSIYTLDCNKSDADNKLKTIVKWPELKQAAGRMVG